MDEVELKALIEGRNDIDFEAFNMLRQMEEDGLLTVECMLNGLLRDGEMDRLEAQEQAKHYVQTFADLVKRRQRLDQAIVRASVQS